MKSENYNKIYALLHKIIIHSWLIDELASCMAPGF